jgi:hypothetical protein
VLGALLTNRPCSSSSSTMMDSVSLGTAYPVYIPKCPSIRCGRLDGKPYRTGLWKGWPVPGELLSGRDLRIEGPESSRAEAPIDYTGRMPELKALGLQTLARRGEEGFCLG